MAQYSGLVGSVPLLIAGFSHAGFDSLLLSRAAIGLAAVAPMLL